MQRLVFLGRLTVGGQGDARGDDRIRAQYGKFLVNEADAAIVFHGP